MRRENTWVRTWTGEQLVENKGTREATPESGQLKNNEVTAEGGEESRKNQKSKANSRRKEQSQQQAKSDAVVQRRQVARMAESDTHVQRCVSVGEQDQVSDSRSAPRSRQSHLRRTSQQNTVETQQIQPLEQGCELGHASRCATTGADVPDSARRFQQLQFVDKVIEILVPKQRRIPVVQTIRDSTDAVH